MKTSEVIASNPSNVNEAHIISMATGLGCAGDSVFVTTTTHGH